MYIYFFPEKFIRQLILFKNVERPLQFHGHPCLQKGFV